MKDGRKSCRLLLVSGGTLDELLDEVVSAMEDADFFQGLAQ